MKRANTFGDMNSEVVKGSKTRTKESSKRAWDELESDKSKKQKIYEHVEAKKDDDPEEEETKKTYEDNTKACDDKGKARMEIVPDKDYILLPLWTVDPTILSSTKSKKASTPMEIQKLLLKDKDGEEVDVHLYRLMIGSLMYLTSSRPDIMFAVYSPFDLVAYTDSDYARVSLDRKSTTGGCQFLGCKLISWQCKKQIVVPNSTT
ncbi:hypothetical protein Tco_0684170 [Tanacetum coccineum]